MEKKKINEYWILSAVILRTRCNAFKFQINVNNVITICLKIRQASRVVRAGPSNGEKTSQGNTNVRVVVLFTAMLYIFQPISRNGRGFLTV